MRKNKYIRLLIHKIILVSKTTSELIHKPRNVVDPVIYDSEKRFVHPFAYLLIGTAVIVLLNLLFINLSISINEETNRSIGEASSQLSYWIDYVTINMATRFLPLSLFLLIPTLALSGMFFFREKTDSFYSNLVLNSYTIGLVNLCLILLIPVWNVVNLQIQNPVIVTYLPGAYICTVIVLVYSRYFYTNTLTGWIRIISSAVSGFIFYQFISGLMWSVTGYTVFAIKRIVQISAGS